MFDKLATDSNLLYLLVVFFTVKITAVAPCGCSDFCYPRDCQDVKDIGHPSGVYRIYPAGMYSGFNVYCDMDTDGGGWLVFQRRMNGIEDFDRDWDDYLRGFGDVSGEHWLGNQRLHLITGQASYELRVELSDWEGNTSHALYEVFRIEDHKNSYSLVVGGYSGDAGNSMLPHDGMLFTTRDRDNDLFDGKNCAADRETGAGSGGWWYSFCFHANLNGIYFHNSTTDSNVTGIAWFGWKGFLYSLKRTEMKIRRT